MDPATILVGAAVGIVVGLTSIGGGALLTPALVVGLGIPPSLAIGSDVLIASGMKLVGGGAYALRRQVHWPTVLRLASGSLPGAALGIVLLNRIPRIFLDTFVGRALGSVLIVAGAATVVRLALRDRVSPTRWPGWPQTAALGFATGVLVSVTSIGSGSLLLCALAFLYPLRAQTLVGTDLVHALLLSAAATIGHASAGRVNVELAASVLAGAVPGVLLGARLARVLSERTLRAALAVVLVGVGSYLALFQAPAAQAATRPTISVKEVQ